MAQTNSPGGSSFAALSGRLLEAAQLAERIAAKSLGKVRLLFLLGVLSALWLAYAIGQAFGFNLVPALLVFALLASPAAMVGWLYFSLRSAQGLPQRVNGLLVRLQARAGEYQKSAAPPVAGSAGAGGKLFDLLRLGRMLVEVQSLSGEAREITAVFAGVALVANPLFFIVILLSGAATLALMTAALISGLFHVF